MTRLIRDKASRSFLTREGKWTNDPRNAWHLSGGHEAHLAQKQLNLQNVELYYCYEEDGTSSLDFVIPLD